MKFKKNLLANLFIAGATIAPPLTMELSGFSENYVERRVKESKQYYKEIYGNERGITPEHMINTYTPFWRYVALDTFIGGGFGFVLGSFAVARKRRLEEKTNE